MKDLISVKDIDRWVGWICMAIALGMSPQGVGQDRFTIMKKEVTRD